MIRILAVIAALICAAPAIAQPLPANLDKQNAIVIDTTKGRIVIKLRPDLAPKHAERIKQLARDGYYNNVPFHRVMDGFMAQTGDGQNFNGTGGSKYPNLTAEFSNVPFKRGIVGMARTSEAPTPPIRSSSSCSPTVRRSTANIPWSARWCRAWTWSTSSRRRGRDRGGAVTDPDKMVKVQVASDIK